MYEKLLKASEIKIKDWYSHVDQLEDVYEARELGAHGVLCNEVDLKTGTSYMYNKNLNTPFGSDNIVIRNDLKRKFIWENELKELIE